MNDQLDLFDTEADEADRLLEEIRRLNRPVKPSRKKPKYAGYLELTRRQGEAVRPRCGHDVPPDDCRGGQDTGGP